MNGMANPGPIYKPMITTNQYVLRWRIVARTGILFSIRSVMDAIYLTELFGDYMISMLSFQPGLVSTPGCKSFGPIRQLDIKLVTGSTFNRPGGLGLEVEIR